MGVNVTSSKFGMWGLSSGMLGMVGMSELRFVYIVATTLPVPGTVGLKVKV